MVICRQCYTCSLSIKKYFLLLSSCSDYRKCPYKQVTPKIFKITTRIFAFNIQGVQLKKTLKSSQNKMHLQTKSSISYVFNCLVQWGLRSVVKLELNAILKFLNIYCQVAVKKKLLLKNLLQIQWNKMYSQCLLFFHFTVYITHGLGNTQILKSTWQGIFFV